MQSLRYTVHGIKTAFNISYLYNKSVFTFCFNNIKIIISAKSLHVITFFILNWMGKWFARPLTQTQTQTNIVTINGNNGNSFGSWERTFAIFALVKMGFQCFSAVGCVHMICCCFFLNVETVFPRIALMVCVMKCYFKCYFISLIMLYVPFCRWIEAKKSIDQVHSFDGVIKILHFIYQNI